MAGKERNHVFPWLDFDCLHIVGRNNFRAGNGVLKCFPQVCNLDFVTNDQIGNIAKIIRTIPASVPGDNAIGIDTSDGNTGLPKLCGSKRHIVTGSAQVNRHFQFQGRNGKNTECVAFYSVTGQGEAGFLQITKTADALLTAFVKTLVVFGYGFPQFR